MATLRFIAGCTLLAGLSAAAAPAGRNTFEPAARPTGQAPSQSVQSSSVIDPLADKLLKQMSTYVAGLAAFTVRARIRCR